MIAAHQQRRNTDEMIGRIKQGESQRKIWFVVTAVAYIVSTAFLIRQSGHWGQTSTDFIAAPLISAALGLGSYMLYRSRVRGGERIGYIMPFMLSIMSCVIVWMVTH